MLVFFSIIILVSSVFFSHSQPSFPLIKYKVVRFDNYAKLNIFLRGFNPKISKTKYRVLTTLNRKELRFFRPKQPIIVPDTFLEDLRAYSVFPYEYPGARFIPKLIVVSNVYQAYACYEFGNLVRFAAAITGKKSTPTYPGRYSLQWKARLRRSSFNENWIMPFTWNFHRLTGSAFHQFEMPGFPASHMCIRQFREDAEWLYSWGEGPKRDSTGKFITMSGTPVIIIDFYDFVNFPKKWLELQSNQQKIDYLPSEPLNVEEALIPITHIPLELRSMIPRKDRIRYETAFDTLVARGVIPRDLRLKPSNSLKKKETKGKGAGVLKDSTQIKK